MKFQDFLKEKAMSATLFKQILLIITFAVFLIFSIFNLNTVINFVKYLFILFSPILGGIAIAYIINLLVNFLENKVFKFLSKFKFWNNIKRGFCITLSFILIFLFFWALSALVLPDLASSVDLLVANVPNYIKSTYSALISLQERSPNLLTFLTDINWQSIIENLTALISNSVKSIFSLTFNFTTGIINVVLSLIVSIYLLANKESLILNLKKFSYAFFSKERADKISSIATLTNKVFSGFVSGQLIEAFILGTLCYIGMSIFRFDYALLISIIVGVTGVIPIFGAYIGAAVGAFLLFMISPVSSVCFVIFLIVLQQLEGNIIYPRVVGTSIGLPGLWVLFAIIVFGNIFGIIGILLGVPTFSVIYTLFNEFLKKRLEDKKISDEYLSSEK